MKSIIVLFALATGICAPAFAEITITTAWVRATAPQQRATGAFMQIHSTRDVKLVAAQPPVARIVEIHEMKMEDNVMKMRQVSGIDIPIATGLELKPGGYHVMLIDLNNQVREGDAIPVTLVFEDKEHKRESVVIEAIGRPLNTASSSSQTPHKH